MPIYDHNGTASHQISKVYDNDGTTSHQVGKVYDNDGTANHLIYTAEEYIYNAGTFNGFTKDNCTVNTYSGSVNFETSQIKCSTSHSGTYAYALIRTPIVDFSGDTILPVFTGYSKLRVQVYDTSNNSIYGMLDLTSGVEYKLSSPLPAQYRFEFGIDTFQGSGTLYVQSIKIS